MHNFHPGPEFRVTVLGAIDQDESLLNGTKADEEEKVKCRRQSFPMDAL